MARKKLRPPKPEMVWTAIAELVNLAHAYEAALRAGKHPRTMSPRATALLARIEKEVVEWTRHSGRQIEKYTLDGISERLATIYDRWQRAGSRDRKPLEEEILDLFRETDVKAAAVRRVAIPIKKFFRMGHGTRETATAVAGQLLENISLRSTQRIKAQVRKKQTDLEPFGMDVHSDLVGRYEAACEKLFGVTPKAARAVAHVLDGDIHRQALGQ